MKVRSGWSFWAPQAPLGLALGVTITSRQERTRGVC